MTTNTGSASRNACSPYARGSPAIYAASCALYVCELGFDLLLKPLEDFILPQNVHVSFIYGADDNSIQVCSW